PRERWRTYQPTSDKPSPLAANRDLLFLSSWPNNGAIHLETHDSYNPCRDKEVNHDRDKLWITNAGTASGNGGGHGDAAVVTAEGMIFWNSPRFIRANREVSK